jgi:hypothetical protein
LSALGGSMCSGFLEPSAVMASASASAVLTEPVERRPWDEMIPLELRDAFQQSMEQARRSWDRSPSEVSFGRVPLYTNGRRIVRLLCASHRSACLTEDGEVYLWGRFAGGAELHRPRRVPSWSRWQTGQELELRPFATSGAGWIDVQLTQWGLWLVSAEDQRLFAYRESSGRLQPVAADLHAVSAVWSWPSLRPGREDLLVISQRRAHPPLLTDEQADLVPIQCDDTLAQSPMLLRRSILCRYSAFFQKWLALRPVTDEALHLHGWSTRVLGEFWQCIQAHARTGRLPPIEQSSSDPLELLQFADFLAAPLVAAAVERFLCRWMTRADLLRLHSRFPVG